MNLTIIDYGAGNVQSIAFAIQRLGVEAKLTSNPYEIESADRVIFPGVGHAGSAMDKLKSDGLDKLIPNLKQPVLGICLGMQLMCKSSEEGDTKALGIFDVEVKKFDLKEENLKVPQIGWNKIWNLKSKLFDGMKEDYIYLVHSYYAPPTTETIASTDYGIPYSAALQKENFYGVQFHPEKSGGYGSRILENFLRQ